MAAPTSASSPRKASVSAPPSKDTHREDGWFERNFHRLRKLPAMWGADECLIVSRRSDTKDKDPPHAALRTRQQLDAGGGGSGGKPSSAGSAFDGVPPGTLAEVQVFSFDHEKFLAEVDILDDDAATGVTDPKFSTACFNAVFPQHRVWQLIEKDAKGFGLNLQKLLDMWVEVPRGGGTSPRHANILPASHGTQGQSPRDSGLSPLAPPPLPPGVLGLDNATNPLTAPSAVGSPMVVKARLTKVFVMVEHFDFKLSDLMDIKGHALRRAVRLHSEHKTGKALNTSVGGTGQATSSSSRYMDQDASMYGNSFSMEIGDSVTRNPSDGVSCAFTSSTADTAQQHFRLSAPAATLGQLWSEGDVKTILRTGAAFVKCAAALSSAGDRFTSRSQNTLTCAILPGAFLFRASDVPALLTSDDGLRKGTVAPVDVARTDATIYEMAASMCTDWLRAVHISINVIPYMAAAAHGGASCATSATATRRGSMAEAGMLQQIALASPGAVALAESFHKSFIKDVMLVSGTKASMFFLGAVAFHMLMRCDMQPSMVDTNSPAWKNFVALRNISPADPTFLPMAPILDGKQPPEGETPAATAGGTSPSPPPILSAAAAAAAAVPRFACPFSPVVRSTVVQLLYREEPNRPTPVQVMEVAAAEGTGSHRRMTNVAGERRPTFSGGGHASGIHERRFTATNSAVIPAPPQSPPQGQQRPSAVTSPYQQNQAAVSAKPPQSNGATSQQPKDQQRAGSPPKQQRRASPQLPLIVSPRNAQHLAQTAAAAAAAAANPPRLPTFGAQLNTDVCETPFESSKRTAFRQALAGGGILALTAEEQLDATNSRHKLFYGNADFCGTSHGKRRQVLSTSESARSTGKASPTGKGGRAGRSGGIDPDTGRLKTAETAGNDSRPSTPLDNAVDSPSRRADRAQQRLQPIALEFAL